MKEAEKKIENLVDWGFFDSEQPSQNQVERSQKELSLVFQRLVALWKKLMKSKSLKIEFANEGNDYAYVLKDDESAHPLGIVYTFEQRLVLDYGGLRDTINKEQLQDFKSMLLNINSMAKEDRILALEEELTKRYK